MKFMQRLSGGGLATLQLDDRQTAVHVAGQQVHSTGGSQRVAERVLLLDEFHARLEHFDMAGKKSPQLPFRSLIQHGPDSTDSSAPPRSHAWCVWPPCCSARPVSLIWRRYDTAEGRYLLAVRGWAADEDGGRRVGSCRPPIDHFGVASSPRGADTRPAAGPEPEQEAFAATPAQLPTSE